MRRVNTAGALSQRDAYKLMLKEYPDVLGIDQMCEILGISTKTGYRILREGKICCLKVGRAYRIPKAHLLLICVLGAGGAIFLMLGLRKLTNIFAARSSNSNPVLV